MILNRKRLCFKHNAKSAIENFIVSRYHMYERLYLHDTAIAWDLLVQKIIERARDLVTNNYQFQSSIPVEILQLLICKDFTQVSVDNYCY